jgi:uncharacterized protein (UPF0332 family)
MPIEPKSFCEVAQQLNASTPPTGEPCFRTAIGRAYYAAYLATRAALRSQFNAPTLDVGHSVLVNALRFDAPDQQVRKIGSLLASMRERRERADYEPEDTLTYAEAQQAVRESQFVLTKLLSVRGRLPRV